MGDPFLPPKARTEEWGTPEDLFKKLDDEFHFTLDAAASHLNHKCDKYYTKEDDGVSKSWKGETVFCNPPYNVKDLTRFAEKLYAEALTSGTTSVYLVPSKTDQGWFHLLWGAQFHHPLENYGIDVEFRWIRGRLKYNGKTTLRKTLPSGEEIYLHEVSCQDAATFPSVVIVVKGV